MGRECACARVCGYTCVRAHVWSCEQSGMHCECALCVVCVVCGWMGVWGLWHVCVCLDVEMARVW